MVQTWASEPSPHVSYLGNGIPSVLENKKVCLEGIPVAALRCLAGSNTCLGCTLDPSVHSLLSLAQNLEWRNSQCLKFVYNVKKLAAALNLRNIVHVSLYFTDNNFFPHASFCPGRYEQSRKATELPKW